jgi:hypothetical protein
MSFRFRLRTLFIFVTLLLVFTIPTLLTGQYAKIEAVTSHQAGATYEYRLKIRRTPGARISFVNQTGSLGLSVLQEKGRWLALPTWPVTETYVVRVKGIPHLGETVFPDRKMRPNDRIVLHSVEHNGATTSALAIWINRPSKEK